MPDPKTSAENEEVARKQEQQKLEAQPSYYIRKREAEGNHEFSGGRFCGGGVWGGRDR